MKFNQGETIKEESDGQKSESRQDAELEREIAAGEWMIKVLRE